MNDLRVGNRKLPRECSYSRTQEAMQMNNLTVRNRKLPKWMLAAFYLSLCITIKDSEVRCWGKNLINHRNGKGTTSWPSLHISQTCPYSSLLYGWFQSASHCLHHPRKKLTLLTQSWSITVCSNILQQMLLHKEMGSDYRLAVVELYSCVTVGGPSHSPSHSSF